MYSRNIQGEIEHSKNTWALKGYLGTRALKALGHLGSQVLEHSGTRRILGHSGTQKLGHLSTRGTCGTLFSRLRKVLRRIFRKHVTCSLFFSVRRRENGQNFGLEAYVKNLLACDLGLRNRFKYLFLPKNPFRKLVIQLLELLTYFHIYTQRMF